MKTKFSAFTLKALVVSLAVCWMPFSFGQLAVSEERIKAIDEIIEKVREDEDDIMSASAKRKIFKEIARKHILDPDKKLEDIQGQDIRAEVDKLVKEKFPRSTDEVRKQAEADADKKFSLAKPMDQVSVEFKRGFSLYRVEGTFYSQSGNSVKIGDKYVALYDMVPESRIKFDKAFCDAQKSEFVSDKVAEYNKAKMATSTSVMEELKKKQAREIEAAGYVFAFKSWRTMRETAEICISEAADRKPAKKKTKPKKTTEAEEGEKTAVAEAPKKTAEPPGEKSETTGSKVEEIKKKAQEAWLEIGGKRAGIDADQGYQPVLWGMSKEEAKILLDDAKGLELVFAKTTGGTPAPNVETAKIENPDGQDGPIASVELSFYFDKLSKVSVNFRITSLEAMQKFSSLLYERYGPTDEQKKASDAQPPAQQPKKTDEEEDNTKKKSKSKEKDKKPPPKVLLPAEQVCHWTGSFTVGTLTIKANADRSAFSQFVLVKESPAVKAEGDNKIKDDNRMRQEEKKKKELEKMEKLKGVNF